MQAESNAFMKRNPSSEVEVPKKTKISICAIRPFYCISEPIGVKFIFENVSYDKILIVNPETCKAWIYFSIKNSKGEEIKPAIIADPRKQIATEAGIKLSILKPKESISISIEDITSQDYGQEKYILEEGTHLVTAMFKPRGRILSKDGREAYTENNVSNEISIFVSKCNELFRGREIVQDIYDLIRPIE